MTYEIEIYKPFSQVPEISQVQAKSGTELMETAYRISRGIKAGILLAANPRTRQEWKEAQSACSYVHISFGPGI